MDGLEYALAAMAGGLAEGSGGEEGPPFEHAGGCPGEQSPTGYRSGGKWRESRRPGEDDHYRLLAGWPSGNGGNAGVSGHLPWLRGQAHSHVKNYRYIPQTIADTSITCILSNCL